MHVVAKVVNSRNRHAIRVATDGTPHALMIDPNDSGFGSSVNGAELLLLALATCYCNVMYREAKTRGIAVHSVEVEASAEFGARGEATKSIRYRAGVRAEASSAEIAALLAETDRVAEIQNTLRAGCSVEFTSGGEF
jgi:organic hydroperoxide reductase OsmC/OhrA